MAAFNEGLGEFGVLLQRTRDAKHAHLNRKLAKYVQHAPGAAATAEFESRFNKWYAAPAMGVDADVVEHAFGFIVTVCKRQFTAAFDIEIEIDGDERVVRPRRMRRRRAISNKIARDHRIGFRLNHAKLAF